MTPSRREDDWRRSHTCGELRAEHVGQTVTLNGWVDGRRNLGGIFFVLLRDRYGRTQVLVDDALLTQAAPSAEDPLHLSPEDCITVRGEVVAREEGNENTSMPTGAIEVRATHLERLSRSQQPPFEIVEDLDTSVDLRLQYRFLDLRRPDMQRALMHRSKFIGAMRQAFLARDFCDIETPILTKATPEGARDYLVPSRVHPGKWYALPQSPQIFKQILMVSGFDRYFQVARCFRDEDLRADRQPEFTQLDMEMSFVEEQDVWEAWEGILVDTFRDAMGVDLPQPFPRLRWREAMERFGVDKPDTRYGMELVDLAEWVPGCEFKVFQGALDSGGRVMGIAVPDGGSKISRGNMKKLESLAKDFGAKGLAWWKPDQQGGAAGPLARFVAGDGNADVGQALIERMGASQGDLLLFCAAPEKVTWRVLGELRVHLARELELVPEGRWDFLWVTHFPMFEWDAELERWSSSHHPFTAPADWELGGDPADMASRAYDLVLNGWELGSGSIRIHRQDVQRRVFELLGIGPEEQRRKFGFLLDALSFGAPPHGGFAVGLDRLVAMTLGMDSIRDVVAFPKTTSAADIMCDAPSTVDAEQLTEVHVENLPQEKAEQSPDGQ